MNGFSYEFIFLIVISVISISVNIVIFLLYFRKRSFSESYERVFKKNTAEDYKQFDIPKLYKKDYLQLTFDKHVKQKEDFNKWKNLIISKFQEIHKIPSLENIRTFPMEKIFTKNMKITRSQNIQQKHRMVI